jgi:hypothetical protein
MDEGVARGRRDEVWSWGIIGKEKENPGPNSSLIYI